MEPLPAADRAEGVTKSQPLIQGNYFEDSDLNEESPRGSHTYPLIPFYTLLLAPTPNSELKSLREQKTAGWVTSVCHAEQESCLQDLFACQYWVD